MDKEDCFITMYLGYLLNYDVFHHQNQKLIKSILS